MISYILKRIISVIPVLLLVTIIVFSVIHIVPGDPVVILLGPQATVEQIEFTTKLLNLDKPVIVQYFTWLGKLIKGDLGNSIRQKRPVLDLIKERIGLTIMLAVMAMIFAIIVSLPLGILAAKKQNTFVDFSAVIFSLFGISLPEFLSGVLLILIFALKLKLLPSFGYVRFSENPLESIRFMLLPVFANGFIRAGYLTRMIRSQMIEVLGKHYIKTARAKGLKESSILFKHALKNSLIPIITAIGTEFAFILGGAVITETIFGIPGMGKLLVNSIFSRDFPIIQGVVLIIVLIFVFINLFVDITYAFLNPKIRLR